MLPWTPLHGPVHREQTLQLQKNSTPFRLQLVTQIQIFKLSRIYIYKKKTKKIDSKPPGLLSCWIVWRDFLRCLCKCQQEIMPGDILEVHFKDNLRESETICMTSNFRFHTNEIWRYIKRSYLSQAIFVSLAPCWLWVTAPKNSESSITSTVLKIHFLEIYKCI